ILQVLPPLPATVLRVYDLVSASALPTIPIRADILQRYRNRQCTVALLHKARNWFARRLNARTSFVTRKSRFKPEDALPPVFLVLPDHSTASFDYESLPALTSEGHTRLPEPTQGSWLWLSVLMHHGSQTVPPP